MEKEMVLEQIDKYIDPFSDYGFKLLFGSEPNKDLLISFLNALFKGKKVIIDLAYNKNEVLGPVKNARRSVYDLTCTGQDGEQFIIEIQRAKQKFFKDRAVFYTSTLIQELGQKGTDWNFELKEAIWLR